MLDATVRGIWFLLFFSVVTEVIVCEMIAVLLLVCALLVTSTPRRGFCASTVIDLLV